MNTPTTGIRLVVGGLAAAIALGFPVAAGSSGVASAAVHCGRPDMHRVVHCANGDRQFVDRRGHLLTVNRLGVVVRDLAPGRPWY